MGTPNSLVTNCYNEGEAAMPLSIHDDAETALIEVAAVFERFEDDRLFTGQQISVALQRIAATLHGLRKRGTNSAK
jgi:hypothetical protein